MGSARRAVSILQVLAVIAVAATLSSLTLVAVRALDNDARRARTASILATVSKGLALSMADHGALLSPAEHPLAGSRPGRARFIGWRGRTFGVDGGVDGGELVELDRDHEALTGVAEWQLTCDRDRVLMRDDVFADARVPSLFGMARGDIGIIGDPQQAVTRHRRLHPPAYARCFAPGDIAAVDSLVQPDRRHEDGRTVFGYLFATSSAQSELTAIGALHAPADDDAANRIAAPAPLAGLDGAGRVWSRIGCDPHDGATSWQPGLIQDGRIDRDGPGHGDPDWKSYRLRGLAIYDAWDHEVLFSMRADGGAVLLSGGHDGAFRLAPGLDRCFQTTADALAPAGDDLDATRDNVRVELAP